MKTFLGLATFLMFIAGYMGCSTTANNANLRNTNTNTGYMVNDSKIPMPAASSPIANSNMNNSKMNTNLKPAVNSKMNTNANEKMANKPMNK